VIFNKITHLISFRGAVYCSPDVFISKGLDLNDLSVDIFNGTIFIYIMYFTSPKYAVSFSTILKIFLYKMYMQFKQTLGKYTKGFRRIKETLKAEE
jgi:hypothetical protein